MSTKRIGTVNLIGIILVIITTTIGITWDKISRASLKSLESYNAIEIEVNTRQEERNVVTINDSIFINGLLKSDDGSRTFLNMSRPFKIAKKEGEKAFYVIKENDTLRFQFGAY